MMELAESAFDVKNDREQLDVDQSVIERLSKIHQASVSEEANEDGPVAWVLVFPTKLQLMEKFLKKEISEKELFNLTEIGDTYDVIYLCSAMVL